MFHAYTCVAPAFEIHAPTLQERVGAGRYMIREIAESLVEANTDIPRDNPYVFDAAVEAVIGNARGVHEGAPRMFIRNGVTVGEQLAIFAVESINEYIAEAMVS